MRRPLRRSNWTAPLAWSVWSTRKKNKARAGGGAPALRWYYDFDGVGAYGQLSTPIEVTDTKPLEVDFEFKSGLYTRRILGSSVQALTQIRIDPATANRIRLVYSGDFLSFDNALDGLVDGRVYTLRVEASGTNHEIFINGISKGVVAKALAETPLFDLIAVDDATPSSYFTGTIANLKSGDGSVHDYPMNDGPLAGGALINKGTGGNATMLNEITGDWYEAE